jgi:uncharacterized membrane protein YtjA (UPF0391 family)
MVVAGSSRSGDFAMNSVLRYTPVMILPALVYGIIGFAGGGAAAAWMHHEAFSIPMASGEIWRVSRSAVFIGLSLICFFAELLRTALPTRASLWANMLLACAMVPCLALFLLARGFATDEFFLVCLMMFLDFVLDSAILVFTSRRTLAVSHQ